MSATTLKNDDYFIGKFKVIRVLGRGSEGVVYLAMDTKLNREVAIKTTTLGESPDPLLADLLVSTAQTASRLSHPNIVPVFEAGMHEGCPYVVFEYVEGRSMSQMIAADGPMSISRAVVMMSQILAGIAQIHERSLIHGDIKPANILIGADDRARVADFGLLRHERATNVDHTSGTLRYMAPECFDGTVTDCRRDVYALGLVFYEMLTGQPVIDRGGMDTQIRRIVNELPPTPSIQNPRVPRELDEIVLMALRKNPAHRYQNAAEMKRALDRIRVFNDKQDHIQIREAAIHSTVEFLLRRMAHKSDFPALTASITTINGMSDSMDAASIQTLSDTVMRDFALTQKLLRLVNSASMGGGKVTKVSQAITILGIGQLRTMATAMALAGGANGKKSPGIAIALTDAFVAGLISRNVGRLMRLSAFEELFICGMFSPLGELLCLYYLADEYSEIVRRVFETAVQPDAAARSVLGVSFEEMGIAVARHWQFPPVIVNALAPLPDGILAPARDPAGRLWQCAVYAREFCNVARLHDRQIREGAFDAHVARYSDCIPLDILKVRELMKHSVEAAGHYISAAGFSVSDTAMLEGMRELCKSRVPSLDDDENRVTAEDLQKTLVMKPGGGGWRTRIKRALGAMF